MSSISYLEVCDQCRFPGALGTVHTWTGELSLSCPRCGYRLTVRAVVDRARQRADPRRRPWLTRDTAGRIVLRTRRRRGHGAYCLVSRGSACVFGRFARPVSGRTLRWFAAQLRRPGLDRARSYLTRAAGRKVTVLFGKVPHLPRA